MSLLLQSALIWHILLGLIGICFFVAVLVGLTRVNKNQKFLKISSLFGLLSFFGSWIMGGYYYVVHYGGVVKPIIKAGAYPWAHNILMESKEHIFLFIPFLGAIVFLAIWLGEGRFNKPVGILSLLIVIFGIAITLMGMAVSGAVR